MRDSAAGCYPPPFVDRSIERRLPQGLLRDEISAELERLAALLAGAGAYALPEDLEGASGVLFRTSWYLGEREGAPRRWSTRSALAVPCEPRARAAEAHGFRAAGGGAVERVAPPPAIRDRVLALERSIVFGLELYDAKVFRENGLFASGAAAYEALLSDLAGPPERFLPDSREEAASLSPEIARFPADLCDREALRLSLSLALGRTLYLLGKARRRLVSYLDRAGNFIESSQALPRFEREAVFLSRAAALALEPLASPRPDARGGERPADPIAADRPRRLLRKTIASAAREHRAGMESLRRAARRAGFGSRGPSAEASATIDP